MSVSEMIARVLEGISGKRNAGMILACAALLGAGANHEFGILDANPLAAPAAAAAESQKYWYGTPEELKVIKQLGHTANAKLAYEMALTRPWYSFQEMRCVDRLWYAESKFDETEDGGIPQAKPAYKMKDAEKPGEDYAKDASPQIRWGYGYIERPKKRGGGGYGTPCKAYNFFIASGRRGY